MFLDSGEIKTQLIADLLTFAFNQKTKHQLSLTRVLTKMTNDLPSRYTNTDNWETVKELQLADPDFKKPAQIDLINGAGHHEDLMVGWILFER